MDTRKNVAAALNVPLFKLQTRQPRAHVQWWVNEKVIVSRDPITRSPAHRKAQLILISSASVGLYAGGSGPPAPARAVFSGPNTPLWTLFSQGSDSTVNAHCFNPREKRLWLKDN